tara:strand:+ start:313 stop:717 length:405 start_codon:yes stop_codon:yes gene_type:complete
MGDSSEECIFCFEDISKYDVAILNCRHKYHLHCIKKWNNKSKNFRKVCPQCNIEGEIINVEKGEKSSPNSPIKNTDESDSYTYYNNLQSNTYYDERFNLQEVPLIDEHDQVIIPNRQRTINEELEDTLICCTIL